MPFALFSESAKHEKILAISSGGGHWVELMRLVPAFQGMNVHFASVDERLSAMVEGHVFHKIPDATAKSPIRMIYLIFSVIWLLIRVRPSVIVTTGAAPGCWAVLIGRIFCARTLWIDSIANARVLSRSCEWIRGRATAAFTQWPDLADAGINGGRVEYHGSVLSDAQCS